MLPQLKKYTTGLLAAVLLVTSGTVLVPEAPAHAGMPVLVDASIPDMTKGMWDMFLEGLMVAGKNAAIRFVSYTVRKVAYDSAVWLATGGKGQSPLAETKNFGDYMQNTMDEAAGSAIQELGKENGLNLCKVPDIRMDAALKVGLRSRFLGQPASQQAKPRCTFSDWKKNWGNGDLSKYWNNPGGQFNLTLNTDDSPLGIYGAATGKINQAMATANASAIYKRQEGQGYKSKDSKVSGDVQIPASLIKQEFEANTPSKDRAKAADQIDQMIASGDVKLLPAVMSVFLNTLIGTAVKNFQEKGVIPFSGGCATDECIKANTQGFSGDVASQYYGLSGGGSVAAAQSFFNYMQTVSITEKQNYDLLTQLATCPQTSDLSQAGQGIYGMYNCRIDEGLMRALKLAEAGQPITIDEALKQDALHADWPLVPVDTSGKNNEIDCYTKAYCYSNIQVLRQLRILPLGFEIAAKKSNPDKLWKLGDVIRGFNKCNADTSADDPNSPYCHLIDPNWVLKAPPAKCNVYAYTSNLLGEGVPDRMQECVDVQTCVKFDGAGNCIDYGYCTREKNTWNFGLVDTCKAEFATCRTFSDSRGSSVSYLTRTLDSGNCTKENVGCNAYSLTQDTKGWVAPGLNSDKTNKGIYFNNKVQTSCSASAVGCSAFNFVGNGTNPHYLKKAPDYLGCYDADPASDGIQWPVTESDLAKINARPECSQYAGVCIPSELNCDKYVPTNGGEAVPGRFTSAVVVNDRVENWNDECDKRCVGYAAYREMPTDYSNGETVAYIVPSSGKTCSAEEVGCSAFTNLKTTQNGLEKTEYFTHLRVCVNSAKEKGKQFVTYEGSVNGYQLKSFVLAENPADGSPRYYVQDATVIADLNRQCNERIYLDGTASPDCRQFNDEAGHSYYRLLSYTVPVSDQCTSYRFNSTEVYGQAKCRQAGGTFENDTCLIEGLPAGVTTSAGQSTSCSAAANTCREYKGNNGNNIDQIVNDTFESVTNTVSIGWENGSISPESTHKDGKSLLGTSQSGLIKKLSLVSGESYDLTFWAKGSAGTLTVNAGEPNKPLQTVGKVTVNDNWNLYHVGPFTYNGSTGAGQIYFVNNNGRLFLDNVSMVRVKGKLYLVKNTLSVDPTCDSNLNDNLPGEALGCSAYTNQARKTYYLTGFSQLCRDKAVGCTEMIDTRNTETDKAVAYNVWFEGKETGTLEVKVGLNTYTCDIAAGETGCYVPVISGHKKEETVTYDGTSDELGSHFTSSTIYIPADTAEDRPIYLVADSTATCSQADLGCTLAGAQTITPNGVKFVTTTIKIDPTSDTFTAALCQSEAVGCSAYTDGADTRFFKDPTITGQKICAYRSNVAVRTGANTIQASGWFWKGVGVCSNSGTDKKYCSSNSDCNGGTCQGIGDQPCYGNYLSNNEYGLWSSKNAQYKNFVGECSVAENKCTEFKSDGNAHYLIDNEKLDTKSCSGQVSQREGCILFDRTDNPNKFYNSADLYAESKAHQGALVAAPQTNNSGNDSNTILKVARDRQCGEWLTTGLDTQQVFDVNEGKYKNVSYAINRCDSEGNCGPQVKSEYTGNVLTEGDYRGRLIGWDKMDYSGYSILGQYPVEELSEWNFSTSSRQDWHLVKEIACGGDSKVGLKDPANANCTDSVTGSNCKNEGARCGYASKGICRNARCVVSVDSTSQLDKSPAQRCRAYPEKDAPYPNTTRLSLDAQINSSQAVVQAFSAAHFCSESDDSTDLAAAYGCDCSYEKIQYGDSITKYWNYFTPNSFGGVKNAKDGSKLTGQVPEGICVGGSKEVSGKACSSNGDCGDEKSGSSCQPLTKVSKHLGMQGYCLEEDISRTIEGDPSKHPCLTWWPSRQGSNDLYNQFVDAGFNPSKYNFGEGPYYCTEKKKYEFIEAELHQIQGMIDCDAELKEKFGKEASKYNNQSVVNFYTYLISEGAYRKSNYDDGNDNDLGCASKKEDKWVGTDNVTYLANAYNCDLPNGAYDEECSQLLAKRLCTKDTQLKTYAAIGGEYTLRNLIKVDVVSENDEDTVTIAYECVPKMPYWQDDLGNDVEKSFTNAKVPYKAEWCTSLYQVASTETGNKGGNKAWTERTWKLRSEFAHDTWPFDKECGPFGATSLATNPPDFGPIVVNKDGKCRAGEMAFDQMPEQYKGERIDKNTNQPIPGTKYELKPYATKVVYPSTTTLKDIFAKAYAQYQLVPNQKFTCNNSANPLSLANGKDCKGDDGKANDEMCQVEIHDTCQATTRLVCMDDPDGLKVAAGKRGISCKIDDDCLSGLNTTAQELREAYGTQYTADVAQYLCRPASTCTGNPNKFCDSDAQCDAQIDRSATCKTTTEPNSYHYEKVPQAKLWDVSYVVNGAFEENQKYICRMSNPNSELQGAPCVGLDGKPDNTKCQEPSANRNTCVGAGTPFVCRNPVGSGFEKFKDIRIDKDEGTACVKDIDCFNNKPDASLRLAKLGLFSSEQTYAYNGNEQKYYCVAPRCSNNYSARCTSNEQCGGTGTTGTCSPTNQSPATQTEASDVMVNAKPPVVVGLSVVEGHGECTSVDGKEICKESNVPGFSIFANNRLYTNESVVLKNSGSRASIRFYAYADNNQMPIKRMAINWGDGKAGDSNNVHTFEGLYRNQRGTRDGYCDKGTCKVTGLFMGKNGSSGTQSYGTCTTNTDCRNLPVCTSPEQASYFGIQKNVTCSSDYYNFANHVYTCTPNGPGWTDSCPNSSIEGGCCVFKPRVHVTDNWGWSTGNCQSDNLAHTNGGCFNGKAAGLDDVSDETDPASLKSWLYYGNTQSTSTISIYVAPAK